MNLYAVFGNPIQHSLSPVIHQLFAFQTGKHLVYKKILVPHHQLAQTVTQFLDQGGKGFNITQPFKQEAFQLSHTVSERAAVAQAVNTMLVREDGTLWGDNTDGVGLVRDLTLNHSFSLQHKTILLLGAGGATRGILGPLLDEKPAQVMIANRTLQNALVLSEQFSTDVVSTCELDHLPPISFDFIINSINAEIDLPMYIIGKQTVCYDLIYAKNSFFSAWAERVSAQYVDGLGMLVEQAAEAFYLWHGVRPETLFVIQQLRS